VLPGNKHRLFSWAEIRGLGLCFKMRKYEEDEVEIKTASDCGEELPEMAVALIIAAARALPPSHIG
jgi:hypothetical protein